MKKTATITGKRQITIPIKLYKAIGLDKSKKVIISQEKDGLSITSATNQVDKLAGSLKMPLAWRGKDLDEITTQSKQEHLIRQNKK